MSQPASRVTYCQSKARFSCSILWKSSPFKQMSRTVVKNGKWFPVAEISKYAMGLNSICTVSDCNRPRSAEAPESGGRRRRRASTVDGDSLGRREELLERKGTWHLRLGTFVGLSYCLKTKMLYSHYWVLWLSDSVTYWIQWLFCQFPNPYVMFWWCSLIWFCNILDFVTIWALSQGSHKIQ